MLPPRSEPRPEDVLMVAKCLEGDATSWEALVLMHKRRVFNIAYKFTGRHDRAEDLSQEIFLRIFKNLGKFDPAADFGKWLASVARNHCIDNYRSTRREQRTMVDDGFAFDMAAAPSSTDPLRSIEANEAKEFLRVGLATLPEKLREAVVLRDLKGLAYEEMAVRLSLPVGTIKSRINRGREELARALRARGSR
ncbi:MAG: RNA polymerase sigma factor [Vicinamibacteria bacterium]